MNQENLDIDDVTNKELYSLLKSLHSEFQKLSDDFFGYVGLMLVSGLGLTIAGNIFLWRQSQLSWYYLALISITQRRKKKP